MSLLATPLMGLCYAVSAPMRGSMSCTSLPDKSTERDFWRYDRQELDFASGFLILGPTSWGLEYTRRVSFLRESIRGQLRYLQEFSAAENSRT